MFMLSVPVSGLEGHGLFLYFPDIQAQAVSTGTANPVSGVFPAWES